MQQESTPRQPTNHLLMRRAAAGDRQAFALLVERHHSRALRFAYSLCGEAEAACDLAQEALLRILKAARRGRSYRPQGAFSTYLYAVLRNLRLEELRRGADRRFLPLEDNPSVQGGAGGGAPQPELMVEPLQERVLEEDERRGELWRALGRLPEEQRTAFLLSVREGLSYAEIARVCRCPEGTVASRKHQAVRRLRELLDRGEES